MAKSSLTPSEDKTKKTGEEPQTNRSKTSGTKATHFLNIPSRELTYPPKMAF